MSLVNAKCPNCGAPLKVDIYKKAAVCPYCNEAYIVEEAINYYVTNNYMNVEHLHAGVVNFNANPDFDIRAGELVAYHGNAVDVAIPKGIKRIGGQTVLESNGRRHSTKMQGAFEGCSFLRSIIIPESVEEIGENAFLNCTRLETVNIPDNVVIIGKAAFSGCKALKSVQLPNRLKTLGDYAFLDCSLINHITVPPNLAGLGWTDSISVSEWMTPFYGCCGVESVRLSENVTTKALLGGSHAHDVRIELPEGRTYLSFEDAFFHKNDSDTTLCISELVVPDTVETIRYTFGTLREGAVIPVNKRVRVQYGLFHKRKSYEPEFKDEPGVYKVTNGDVAKIKQSLCNGIVGTQILVHSRDLSISIKIEEEDVALYNCNIIASPKWKASHSGELKNIESVPLL